MTSTQKTVIMYHTDHEPTPPFDTKKMSEIDVYTSTERLVYDVEHQVHNGGINKFRLYYVQEGKLGKFVRFFTAVAFLNDDMTMKQIVSGEEALYNRLLVSEILERYATTKV